jgi:membrane protein DedA with SNARE-associated domain
VVDSFSPPDPLEDLWLLVLRNRDPDWPPPDDLAGRVPVEPLRAGVPACDHPVECHADDRVVRLKAAYRRHALKTVVTARHVMGLRAAAFLTAGIARVPFWKFVVADAGAAVLGIPLEFGLAYFFTDQIKAVIADVHRAERWLGLAVLLALEAILAVVVWRWNRRVGKQRLDEEQTEGHSPP